MINPTSQVQVALCAIAKNEALYIKDWLDYHLCAGFSTIILGDNNNPDDDSLKVFLDAYPYKDKVIYKDVRGKQAYQCIFYNSVYSEYSAKFSWIAYWDIDEFIMFDTHYTDINGFVSDSKFRNFNVIWLNWKCYTDGGKLYWEDKPVYERFTEEYPHKSSNGFSKLPASRHIDAHIKSIVRCIPGKELDFTTPHNAVFKHKPKLFMTRAIQADGTAVKKQSPWSERICHSYAWLNHYRTLTIDEFFKRRWNRGRATIQQILTWDFLCNLFFEYNKKTNEKLEVAKKYKE